MHKAQHQHTILLITGHVHNIIAFDHLTMSAHTPIASEVEEMTTTPLQSISSLLRTPPFSAAGADTSAASAAGKKSPSYIAYHSKILLSQSLPNRGTRTLANQHPIASLSGQHLSQKHELLSIVPVNVDVDVDTNGNDVGNSNAGVHYSDTICIRHEDKFMGVRKGIIGFYRSFRGQAEQWTILNPNAGDASSSTNASGAVEAGQPILFQNELTGELLSSSPPELGIDANANTSAGAMPSLLNFQASMDANSTMDAGLQLTYSAREKWSLDLIHTPPLPNPNFSTRVFLTGDYLSMGKDRNVPPSCTYNDYTNTSTGGSSAESARENGKLAQCAVNAQDSVLVEEVLGALLGLEGNFIQYIDERFVLCIQEDPNLQHRLDDNAKSLVEKILPTASEYVAINKFVSTRLGEFEHGMVSHALCGAIESLLQEYLDFVTGMDDEDRKEAGGLTLSTLWGRMHACVRTISILHDAVEVSRDLKGGALLNALEELRQIYLGDDIAKVVFEVLIDRASIPYIAMLRGWLKDGTLNDPFAEFMIEESGRMKQQDFCYSIGDGSVDQWPSWYSLRDEHVLNVMKSEGGEPANNLASVILTTGKYWNATMLCEHRDTRAAQLQFSSKGTKKVNLLSGLCYGMSAAEIARVVEKEYEAASRTFLNIIMRDYGAINVLAFMKRYFLLDQGDFFVHFLDMAEEELLQEMSDVSRGRVQNWMALSIQMSGGGSSNEENSFPGSSRMRKQPISIVSSLTGAFATDSLISHLDALHASSGGIGTNEPKTPSRHTYGGVNKGLTGVEAFMLDFHTVPFPLSLILSRHAIANYQLMFRHLFFAKHVERRLVGTWLDHQVIKEYSSLRKDLGKTYFLRQRMLHFMQNFVYYMMFEVIEPNYLQMEAKLSGRGKDEDSDFYLTDGPKQRTVDDVLYEHNKYLQKTLNECLLSNRDLVRTLTKLMTTCLLFSDQMKLFIEQTQIVSSRIFELIIFPCLYAHPLFVHPGRGAKPNCRRFSQKTKS